MWRHVQSLQNIETTKFVIKIGMNASTASIQKAMGNVLERYEKSGKAKSVAAAKALTESTDFERYQLRVAKRSRAHWSRKIFAEKDSKQKISWHSKLAAKLEKGNAKFLAKRKGAKKAPAGKKTAKK
jgi:large subunit ribosomal protein L14e